MVSGEPIPVEKHAGIGVIGGTVNGTGALVMRGRARRRRTLLAQIVAMVARAQRSRAPIQRLADVVAGWFVPAVVAVAVITFIVWGGRARAAMAHPRQRRRRADHRVPVRARARHADVDHGRRPARARRSACCSRTPRPSKCCEKVDTLVVDKTGTLTEGKPQGRRVVARPALDEATLLRLVASLEQGSEHPLAAAIVAVRRAGLTLGERDRLQSRHGKGVTGTSKVDRRARQRAAR
jgi:Cu+-exporting ATPase